MKCDEGRENSPANSYNSRKTNKQTQELVERGPGNGEVLLGWGRGVQRDFMQEALREGEILKSF